MPTTAAGQNEIESGTELISVYIGASCCAPCMQPEVREAVRSINDHLREQAARTDRNFFAIGVAMDYELDEGIELLRGTAEFDEIVVGRNWGNTAVIEHVWMMDDINPAVPQIVVFERTLDKGQSAMLFGPKNVLKRVLGGEEIPAWAAAGAPLP